MVKEPGKTGSLIGIRGDKIHPQFPEVTTLIWEAKRFWKKGSISFVPRKSHMAILRKGSWIL